MLHHSAISKERASAKMSALARAKCSLHGHQAELPVSDRVGLCHFTFSDAPYMKETIWTNSLIGSQMHNLLIRLKCFEMSLDLLLSEVSRVG